MPPGRTAMVSFVPSGRFSVRTSLASLAEAFCLVVTDCRTPGLLDDDAVAGLLDDRALAASLDALPAVLLDILDLARPAGAALVLGRPGGRCDLCAGRRGSPARTASWPSLAIFGSGGAVFLCARRHARCRYGGLRRLRGFLRPWRLGRRLCLWRRGLLWRLGRRRRGRLWRLSRRWPIFVMTPAEVLSLRRRSWRL